MKPLALALLLLAVSPDPVRANGITETFPVVTEVQAFANRPLTAATMRQIDVAFEALQPAIVSRLRQSANGPGPVPSQHFRVRFRVQDGYVDIFDGLRHAWKLTPRPVADAIKLVRAVEGTPGSRLRVNWTHPIRDFDRSLGYRAREGDGDTIDFELDGHGHCLGVGYTPQVPGKRAPGC